MIPVLTVEEMAAVDRDAAEPVDVLIERAGAAVARAALDLLGGAYGRRVVVVAGKGNNGADGRSAARRLSRRGVAVTVIDAATAPAALRACDLVIDAAYGTGFRGNYTAPDPGGAPVLAVDIPSGVNGDTGEADDGAVRADATVTFAALKPGLLLGAGPDRCGRVTRADIGLDVTRARTHVVEDGDVLTGLPRRRRDGHKWDTAVYVVAGSPGMLGAAALTSQAALRAGAGMVRMGSPGADPTLLPASEIVGRPLPLPGWDDVVLPDLERSRALAIGPGLGREDETATAVRRLLAEAPMAAVVDADGLFALGKVDEAAPVVRARRHPTVLTPHEGEFTRLAGAAPGPDRVGAVRDLAAALDATVLLKGPTTIVAAPDGRVLLATAGTPALATAGTGDVLTGVVAAFLAAGLPPLEAAALAAHAHGSAARLGPERGLVASDLLDLLPRWLSGGVGAPPVESTEFHRHPRDRR